MSWRQRLAKWIAGKPIEAPPDPAPAPTAEDPNENGPKTDSETEPETPVTKPDWHAFDDKAEYRRQYSRWSRANKAMEENSVAKQLEAHRRAEELQRHRAQQAQQPPPELSERKKQLFAANPHLRFHTPMLGQLHDHLMNNGVVDDSDHYVDQMAALLDGLGIRFTRPSTEHSGEQQQQQQHEPEPAHHESEPGPEPESPSMPSIPVSAPVSRSIAGSNGSRHDGNGKVTLTPEQRHMARVTFTDPSMSTSEKERLYAQGLLRMQRDPNYVRDGR